VTGLLREPAAPRARAGPGRGVRNVYLYTGADHTREGYNAETLGAVPCPAEMVLAAPGDHSAAQNVLLRADAQLRSFWLLAWCGVEGDAARVRFVLACDQWHYFRRRVRGGFSQRCPAFAAVHRTHPRHYEVSRCVCKVQESRAPPQVLSRSRAILYRHGAAVGSSREAFLDAHGVEACPQQADPTVRTPTPSARPRVPPADLATGNDLFAQVWHARVQHSFVLAPSDGSAGSTLLLSAAVGTKAVGFYAALQNEPDGWRCVGALTLPPLHVVRHAVSAVDAPAGGTACTLHVTPGRARRARVTEHGAPLDASALAFVSRHVRASVPPSLAGFARRGFAAGASVFLLRERPAQGILRMWVCDVEEHRADCACMDLMDCDSARARRVPLLAADRPHPA